MIERSSSKFKTFLIVEDVAINRGLQSLRRFYLLEEIQNKEGMLRVSVYGKVHGPSDCRMLVKQLKSLRNTIHAGDRTTYIVSSWAQIGVYASQQSGEEELLTQAKLNMEIIDDIYSSEDEDNLPQPNEID
jgi:hypothetical protein